jgi:hypothetical protein
MTKILGSMALAAMTVAVAPKAALAYDVPIHASFVVGFSATPNSGKVAHCGGDPLDIEVEAHGDGYSTLGALSLSLQKGISSTGALHGCLTLATPGGATLSAIYDGTQGTPNSNNFVVTASGTLTFTGGTGRFEGASGTATFTAVFNRFYPGSSFAGGTNTAPLQGIAFYLVEGKVSFNGGGN